MDTSWDWLAAGDDIAMVTSPEPAIPCWQSGAGEARVRGLQTESDDGWSVVFRQRAATACMRGAHLPDGPAGMDHTSPSLPDDGARGNRSKVLF